MRLCLMSENRSLAGRSSQLGARRLRNRRRARIALVILFLILCAGIIYELNQPSLRISKVTVYSDNEAFADIATEAMQGSYFGLLPRNSTLFFPASRIRTEIIASYPDIAAVSLFRNGLTGLTIKTNDRVAIARWCGLAPSAGEEEYCYVFDAGGFIFAALATSTQTVNSFRLYAPLAPLETPAKARQGISDSLSLTGLAGEALEPFRATLADAEKLPAAFDLARKFTALGSPVIMIVLRGDEVNDYLESGTRVTYVLGNEENAFTALASSKDTLNFSDGSLEYVDLRFDGKVYLKRK